MEREGERKRLGVEKQTDILDWGKIGERGMTIADKKGKREEQREE